MKLHKDLREFIELLNSHKVEYVIVGGHAVAFHGYPRYTGDIDFFIRPAPDNARHIVEVFSAFGFDTTQISVETLLEPNKIIQIGRPPNRIDLLTSISGVNFNEVWDNRIASYIDGIPVFFIDAQCLVKNKRASGRSKDFIDIEKLEIRDKKNI